MGIFVTVSGFIKKTLTEIKGEFENAYKGIFGNDIDLDSRGPIGQEIGMLSKSFADMWDGAEEIYTARNPDDATGTSLDEISAQTGVIRIAATETKVEYVLLYGDNGTLISAGKQTRKSTEELTYSLLSDVTISKTAALEVRLEPDAPSPGGGESYTVTINATPYNYVAMAGDTVADVIDELILLIDAGTWAGTASNEDDTYLLLVGDDVDGDGVSDISFGVDWTSTLTLFELASGGTFVADEAGENTLPANTLTVIVTPVTGWDRVNNPKAGETGTDAETDDELRIRRALTFLAGNATDDAIQAALLNKVSGVQTATVTSNRSLESNIVKVVFDTDFIIGNIITFTINCTTVTPVPFNTDQTTTMNNIKTQIETDIPNSSVEISTEDANTRTLLISISNVTRLALFLSVSGGASQPLWTNEWVNDNGIPSKSFEAVVEGGLDDDIAQEIWETQPSGISSFGNTTVIIQDSEGRDQTIRFSRAISRYIHVKVKRDFYIEEDYPSNGDDLIKESIVNWSLVGFNTGVDVIRQRIGDPVYQVSGVGDIEISIDVTDNPGDTPTYALDNIPISARELAVFDVSRIVVEALTP